MYKILRTRTLPDAQTFTEGEEIPDEKRDQYGSLLEEGVDVQRVIEKKKKTTEETDGSRSN